MKTYANERHDNYVRECILYELIKSQFKLYLDLLHKYNALPYDESDERKELETACVVQMRVVECLKSMRGDLLT